MDNPGWFGEILSTYRAYKAGFLPNEGALNSQPKGFLQMISIVDDVMNQCNEIENQRSPGSK